MKSQETVKQGQVNQTELSVKALEFGDVVVYNEMADQTSLKINLLEQINNQLAQLEEISDKRRFMMKEVLQFITD